MKEAQAKEAQGNTTNTGDPTTTTLTTTISGLATGSATTSDGPLSEQQLGTAQTNGTTNDILFGTDGTTLLGTDGTILGTDVTTRTIPETTRITIVPPKTECPKTEEEKEMIDMLCLPTPEEMAAEKDPVQE